MRQKVVLVGCGHAHLHAIENAEVLPAQVTLISPDPFWYSGMITGVLGGQYTPEEAQLHPATLAERYGLEYCNGMATDIQPDARLVKCSDGSTHNYDVLSLAIGSTVKQNTLRTSIPIKPLVNVIQLRRIIYNHHPADPMHIAVVGGGPSGCEIAANAQQCLREAKVDGTVTVYHKLPHLLSSPHERAGRAAERYLQSIGVELCTNTTISHSYDSMIESTNGHAFHADVVLTATGLHPNPLCHRAGFTCADDGGLCVNEHLQSVSHANVFGGGDCVHFDSRPLPNVGVYGIRQGPVLFRNIRSFLQHEPLQSFTPQRRCLRILNLGHKHLALRGRWHWLSGMARWWKRWLDARFMKRYRV